MEGHNKASLGIFLISVKEEIGDNLHGFSYPSLQPIGDYIF